MKRPTCEKKYQRHFHQNSSKPNFVDIRLVKSRTIMSTVCHSCLWTDSSSICSWGPHIRNILANSHSYWSSHLTLAVLFDWSSHLREAGVHLGETRVCGGEIGRGRGHGRGNWKHDFNCRQPSFREKVTHTWCWCLGTGVLEYPVVGVGGEGEGGGREFLVHNREGGGCGSHPTSQATIQLWQGGHSPTISAPSWVFQSHPLGFILAGFNSFSSWPTCSAHFSFALQACCPYFRFGQISITLTWIPSKKSWWQIVQTKNMNWCLSHI